MSEETKPENKPEEAPKSVAIMLSDDRGNEWDAIKAQASLAFNSGLLPGSVKSVQQAAIIALKGRELGIPIMSALAGICIINGKATLSAELMLSLIYQRVPGAQVTVTTPPDTQHLECEAIFQRPGGDEMKFRFTLEDARRAELLSKDVWKKYPQDLLRARCISRGARAVFPDATMGCYVDGEVTVEEFQADDHRNEKALQLAGRLKVKE